MGFNQALLHEAQVKLSIWDKLNMGAIMALVRPVMFVKIGAFLPISLLKGFDHMQGLGEFYVDVITQTLHGIGSSANTSWSLLCFRSLDAWSILVGG